MAEHTQRGKDADIKNGKEEEILTNTEEPYNFTGMFLVYLKTKKLKAFRQVVTCMHIHILV